MKPYRKTLMGSIFAFLLGTSCCWISSLAIWFGGVTILGAIASFVESTQLLFVLLGVGLGIISVYLYFRNKRVS